MLGRQARPARSNIGYLPLSAPSPLPRVQLDSLERVRREMARLYIEGKHGRRDVQEVSRLANVIALIGRMIEGADLERRVEALEQAQARLGGGAR